MNRRKAIYNDEFMVNNYDIAVFEVQLIQRGEKSKCIPTTINYNERRKAP
jgi:hypothetical protein